MKERVEKYEFIYDVPPSEKVNHNRFYEDTQNDAKMGNNAGKQGIEAMLSKFKSG